MKVSECRNCPECIRTDNKNYPTCKKADKGIRSIKFCPLEPLHKPWTQREKDRLPLLVGSGTHLRNVALIMGRPYEEVMKMVNGVEKKSCDSCGRIRYCRDKYNEGCDLKQWQDRILVETRTDGLGIN